MLNDLPTIRIYVAAPAQTSFTYPFRPFEAGYVGVEVDGVAFARTAPGGGPLTFSSVSDSDAEGGTIVLGAACVGGELVVIRRAMKRERISNFPAVGPVPNRTLDRQFDYQLGILQELDRDNVDFRNRGLLVPLGEVGGVLPAAADRANKYISFLPDGRLLMSSGTGADSGLRSDLGAPTGGEMVRVAGGRTVQGVVDDLGTVSTQDANDLDVTVSVMRRPGFYNFKASSFLRWSAALSAHRAGVSRAYIACIGDSTMRGVGSNPSSAVADLVRRSWPSVLADALNQMPNTKATANSIWCDGFFTMIGGGNLAIADPRVSWETGWQTHPTMFVTGGKSFLYPSSASGEGRFNFDFTVGSAGPDEDDAVNVHCIIAPGNGQILVTTNNAATFVAGAETTGAAGVGVVSGTRIEADFDTAWTIQRNAGTPGTNLQFYGIESYKAADKPIGVWNMGASGSLAASWVDDNQPYSFVNVIQSLAPHLCIICLTINDWAADTTEATYKAQMQEIIDACIVNSDVLLVVGVPSNTGTAPILRQQAFAGYVRDLAAANDLPVLDLSERWVSQALLPGRGLYYDGLHPTNVGYADVGYLVAQVVGNPGYFFG